MILIIAFLLSLVLTRYAIKLNILDTPNHRKIHSNATPKAGGIGIIAPVVLIQIYILISHSHLESNLLGLLAGTSMLFIAGIVDDKLELPAKIKLAVQALVALISIIMGISFNVFNNILLNNIVTFIWIIGFINAINLIDGLDGLAGGVCLISAAGIYIFGIKYMAININMLCLAMIGSIVGFLRYNFHPAKIFMGDTGSLPLGYLISVMIILTSNQIGGFGGTAICFFIVLIPVYDTLLSVVRRKINGKGIFEPDRSHFYNLLMDKKGLSHKNTVLFIYCLNIILVGVAYLLIMVPVFYRYILALSTLTVVVFISIKADFIKIDE